MTHPSPPGGARLPACRDLDADTLRLLMEDAESVQLSPDEVLYSRGDTADYLYVVCSGLLDRQESTPGPSVREGDLLGVLEVLSGERRTSTVSATRAAELLRVPVARIEAVLAEHPETTEKLVAVAERQLLRREMVRLLPHVFDSLDPNALHDLSRAFSWIHLDRGEELFIEGGPGEAVYVLASGRLQAHVNTPSGAPRVVGEIVPGETVGEMALITGEPRSATVVALRASVLQVCLREDFELLVEQHPPLAAYLTNILVQRLKRANRRESPVERRLSIALVPLHDGIDLESFSAPLVQTLSGFGNVLHLDRAGVADQPGAAHRKGHRLTSTHDRLTDLRLLPWFEEQEALHDFVIYEGEAELSAWTHRCVSQADRIVLIADADHDPGVGALEEGLEDVLAGARPPLHLVLLHPPDRENPRETLAWLEPRQIRAHHHVRRGRTSDVERTARLLTGRALGVVLSGGGARGFAHIGVLTALDDLGIPVDAIGGTSAGAAMAAQYALGRTPSQIRDASHRDMVQRAPFRKYTLPVYSLAGSAGFDQVCKAIAGDLDVSDLWIPYFCTSCDLLKGEKVIHDRGPVWKATRASMSLPGIVPPVIDGDRLLVDGGVLDNIPEEEMIAFCGGRVIAVDVSAGVSVPFDFEYENMPSPWQVLWNRLLPWRQKTRVPTLVDVLMRTATVSNTSQSDVEQNVELLLRPPVHSFGLMDFGALDQIIEVSATYSRVELGKWLAKDVDSGHHAPQAAHAGGSGKDPIDLL